MTQSVLESMARAMWEQNSILCGRAGGLNPWEREIGGMCEVWEILARAALIALRDGVDDNAFMAAWPDSRPGRPAMQLGQKRFKAVLDAVLQEGEKDQK